MIHDGTTAVAGAVATILFSLGYVLMDRRVAQLERQVRRLTTTLSMHLELNHGHNQDALDLLSGLADIAGERRG